MREPRRVGKPPEKPLLLFDGDCGFCKRWVERWKSLTGHRVDFAPSQEAGPRFPEIAAAEFRRSLHRPAEFLGGELGHTRRGSRIAVKCMAARPLQSGDTNPQKETIYIVRRAKFRPNEDVNRERELQTIVTCMEDFA